MCRLGVVVAWQSGVLGGRGRQGGWVQTRGEALRTSQMTRVAAAAAAVEAAAAMVALRNVSAVVG